MSRNGCEYIGKIPSIRDVEDSIRATKKYTKGAFKANRHHPIQGEKFPSKVLYEYYEVYPEVEVRGGAFWDLPVGVALDWLWGDTPCVDVVFRYNYNENRASIKIGGGAESVKLLAKAIPNFSKTLAVVIASETEVLLGGNRQTSKA